MESTTRTKTTEREHVLNQYLTVRDDSVRLCEPLQTEDYQIQTMPEVSPPKWHLAHTSWFFETFLLAAYQKNYKPFHPQYDYLFNSYYVTHGDPYPRAQRGLLSRPTVTEVSAYRQWVDGAMTGLIMEADEEQWRRIEFLVVLGMNHEQQHQELLLTDIKHIFAHNPLKPIYRSAQTVKSLQQNQKPVAQKWIAYDAGLREFGTDGQGFAYDNEAPIHQVYLNQYKLASRLVSNAEYLEFMHDGGYTNPAHWLSEGWSKSNADNWKAPLYWQQRDDEWWTFTLEGMQKIDLAAPVCHVSLYEADAFARWSGKRLPTEFEWEHAASQHAVAGNLRQSNQLKPVAASSDSGLQQIYGDVWEWTSSAYSAYPGYKPAAGSIGEYNGKFMTGQNVLRGGSFATPQEHIRATYRNFFYPKDRWQFSGIRLAE